MISQAESPVAWAMFVYELADAQEALNDLMKELADGAIDADEFRIDIGHVYAHLNRAWYRSKSSNDISDAEYDAATGFPADITPMG
jgi:hypothetical protein